MDTSTTRGSHALRRGRARRTALVCLGIAAMVAGPIATASATSTGAKKLTPLQKGLAFYQGKTITFISGSPGGGTDLTSRVFAPLMASYLHATVNVSDQGQANGVPGQDALAAAAPTGLEIGYVNVGSIASEMFENQPGFNFNPGRLSYIAGEIATPVLFVASPSSPFTSFAAVKNSATPARVLAEFPSSGSTGLELLLNLLGVHVSWITGYSTTSAVATGFYRGDGPTASLSYANAESVMQAGAAKVIAASVTPYPGTLDRGYVVTAPTYAQLLKQFAPKHPTAKWTEAVRVMNLFVPLGFPIVTQARVPGDELLALRAAAKWAYAQPSYRAGALAAGSNPTYVDPVTAKANFNTMVANGAALKPYLVNGTP